MKLLNARLPEATPDGVIEADHLELLQERHEEAVAYDRRRRAESRAIRRFVADQPKRLVNLDAILQRPGGPAWMANDGRMVEGLPEEFTNHWTTRYDARRS